MANNHAMDFGADAMRYTGALLDKNKIAHIGAGENLMEAYRAHRFEKDGVSASVISVCEHEFGLAGEDTPGTAAYDEYLLAVAIKNARADSDYVTVVFHGGCEHAPIPSPQCQSRYRSIIMQGADAVVAMHTHCPQGIEICHGKPIFYSLGNFIFNNVNMMMIESRPIPGRSWEYRFFVDFEGNLNDSAVKNALRGIREEAINMKILGNY